MSSDRINASRRIRATCIWLSLIISPTYASAVPTHALTSAALLIIRAVFAPLKMPKRQDYESDDGFVEDAPKSKKARSGGNELKKIEGKAQVSTEMQKDDEGSEYW